MCSQATHSRRASAGSQSGREARARSLRPIHAKHLSKGHEDADDEANCLIDNAAEGPGVASPLGTRSTWQAASRRWTVRASFGLPSPRARVDKSLRVFGERAVAAKASLELFLRLELSTLFSLP